jgi:hypothetical protein
MQVSLKTKREETRMGDRRTASAISRLSGKRKDSRFHCDRAGGNPRDPEALFFMRLDRMKFPDVMMHYLDKFRFPAHPAGLEFG